MTKRLLFLLPAAAALLLAACQSPDSREPTAQAPENLPADFLNPNEPLHVVINTDGISALDDMSAYAYIEQAFEQVFVEEHNWPGELVFDRWPADDDSDQNQSLRVWLTEWQGRPISEVVARFHVTVQRPGEKSVELGVFRGQASVIAATDNQLIEQFRTAARNAFQKLYPQVIAMAEGGEAAVASE